MRFLFLKKRYLAMLACAFIAAGMFYVVNHPAIVGAAAATRQLPIYCVKRDQKMASLTFDAAWGNARVRSLGHKGSSDRTLAKGV